MGVTSLTPKVNGGNLVRSMQIILEEEKCFFFVKQFGLLKASTFLYLISR